jgi:hypothetical protein
LMAGQPLNGGERWTVVLSSNRVCKRPPKNDLHPYTSAVDQRPTDRPTVRFSRRRVRDRQAAALSTVINLLPCAIAARSTKYRPRFNSCLTFNPQFCQRRRRHKYPRASCGSAFILPPSLPPSVGLSVCLRVC